MKLTKLKQPPQNEKRLDDKTRHFLNKNNINSWPANVLGACCKIWTGLDGGPKNPGSVRVIFQTPKMLFKRLLYEKNCLICNCF